MACTGVERIPKCHIGSLSRQLASLSRQFASLSREFASFKHLRCAAAFLGLLAQCCRWELEVA